MDINAKRAALAAMVNDPQCANDLHLVSASVGKLKDFIGNIPLTAWQRQDAMGYLHRIEDFLNAKART